MPKALVDANGLVVNIIEWSAKSDYTPPDGTTLVAVGTGCAVGGTYDATAKTFAPPTPPAPPIPPPTGAQFAALTNAVMTLTLKALPPTGGA